MSSGKTIYTIGHSTRTKEEFLSLLESVSVNLLIDVRRFPFSKRYPHFNSADLSAFLQSNNILYVHMESLGGRRKPFTPTHHPEWKNISFRGYADYTQTDEYRSSIIALEDLAEKFTCCIMCSEAVWWRCHRSIISDTLKDNGWNVIHIISLNNLAEHPYTTVRRQLRLLI